jgi:hypothetical protein
MKIKKYDDILNEGKEPIIEYKEEDGKYYICNPSDGDWVEISKKEYDNYKVTDKKGKFTKVDESKNPMSDSKVMSRLTKGFAIQVDEEDYDKFFDLIDEYGDMYPGGINYNRIGIKTKPAKLYFVLIGNQIYHTTTPKFGGEDLEVYIPVF